MMPSDLPDEMLDAVHAGADPLFFKDRPRYYTLVAEALAGWSTATNSAVKSLVRDAQASGDRAARAADRHRLAVPVTFRLSIHVQACASQSIDPQFGHRVDNPAPCKHNYLKYQALIGDHASLSMLNLSLSGHDPSL